MRSLLRAADQARGAFPNRCVRTGEKTDGAMHLRVAAARVPVVVADLLGPLGCWAGRVALPVTEPILRRHRRAMTAWFVVAAVGAGAVVGGELAFAALLLIVAAIGQFARRRRHWIQARRTGEDVVIIRGHARFDEAARRLFEQSIRSGH